MVSPRRLVILAAAWAISLAACAQAPRPAADPNWALVERVRQALARDTSIPDDIDVSASGGVVSLWGRVNNEKERRRAAEIAAAVGGVQRVENKLLVKTD
jgi:osmotically-inducible protein OsmY